mgnify:FL=1
MKVACLVPVRNKAFFVGHTIKSTLDQTYPCEILLSDQGSTDGSLDILKYHQSAYRGPHHVRLLQCPDTEPKGMAGFNVHIHWLMAQTDADLIVIVSADDLNHPDRVRRTVEEYQKHRPSFIGTKMQFLSPPADGSLKMEVEGITAFDPKGSRFITAREHIEQLVGGSVSTAWDREFYEKIGGLSSHMIPDVYLPFLATLDRGFYMIDEQLFAYIRHPGEGNTGIGGRMLAAEQDGEMLFLNELANYQIVSTYYEAGRVAVRTFPEAWEGSDASEALYQNIVHRTNDWVLCRDYMNVRGQQPRVL